MGRSPRRHEPGQFYLVTTRCHQARFFLRPDRELNEAVFEWLARAQEQFPHVRILAVCVLSNHLHLVVRDGDGQLAAWASYFFGQLARAVNRIRGRRGTFFERRYSAEPILDDDALLDRIVYVVVNPVNAGLCKRARNWSGVVLFAAGRRSEVIPVSWVDRDEYRAARAQAELHGYSAPKEREFRVEGRLIIDPIFSPGAAKNDRADIASAIDSRERQLAQERRQQRRKTLTAKQVRAQSWRSAPRKPKRSRRPLCHASDPRLRKHFLKGFLEFVDLFWQASECLRAGDLTVEFPDWCYPPGRPLIHPAEAGAG